MTVVNSGLRSVRQALSLLELLAVVTIIAIIASIVVPRVTFHAFSAKQKACLQYRSDLNKAIEKYMFEHGAPPAQLTDLENSDYYSQSIPLCPADHTTYTIDSATDRIAGHDH